MIIRVAAKAMRSEPPLDVIGKLIHWLKTGKNWWRRRLGTLKQSFQSPSGRGLSWRETWHNSHFELVTTTITLEDGSTGTGYSYTGGKGGYAIKAMIDHDLAPVLSGKEALRLTISMTLWNSIFTMWVAEASHRLRCLRWISPFGIWKANVKNCRCGKWLVEGGASVDEWRSFGMLARYAGITRQTGFRIRDWLTGGSQFPDRSIYQTSAGGRQLSRRGTGHLRHWRRVWLG